MCKNKMHRTTHQGSDYKDPLEFFEAATRTETEVLSALGQSTTTFTAPTSTAGDSGAVPAPAPGDIGKFLSSGALWKFVHAVGDYKYSAQTVDHDSWLVCDGGSLDTTSYAKLFAVINYRFGGSGASFNKPNLEGKTLAVSSSSDNAGTTTGNDTLVLTGANLPAHSHDMTHSHNANSGLNSDYSYAVPPGHYGMVLVSGGNRAETISSGDATSYEPDLMTRPGIPSHTHNITVHTHNGHTGPSGSSQALNMRQPTVYVSSVFIYSGKH